MAQDKQNIEDQKNKEKKRNRIAKLIGETGAILALPFIATYIIGKESFSGNKKLNLSLQEFLDQNSGAIDKMILSTEKNKDTIFIGGRILLEVINDNSLISISQLYFKQKEEDFLKQEIKSNPVNMEMILNDQAIAELQIEKRMVFEINHPNSRPDITD